MATPVWNKDRKLWIIQGQKNGIRKVFYSSVAGQKGKREVIDRYDDWLNYGEHRVTVQRCIELYLEDIEARLGRKDTYKKVEKYTRLYVLPTLGKARMDNLTLRDWQAILNEARPQSERIESLSYKTMCHLRTIIVGLHKFAYTNYYCDEWRGSLYIPQGHEKGQKEILQPDQIKRLFEPSDLWYHAAFMVMLLCGLRPGECYGLQEGDIGDGVIYIRRAVNDDGEITSGKNKNARRTVPLPNLAKSIIEKNIERNHKMRFETEWIFPNTVGGVACPDSARKQWRQLCSERNLSGSPYCLRHTFVSIVSSQTHLTEGTIKDLVGHSESMDTGIYRHRVDGQLEQAAEVINLTFERLKAEENV